VDDGSLEKRRGVAGQVRAFDAGAVEGEEEDDSCDRETDGRAYVLDAAWQDRLRGAGVEGVVEHGGFTEEARMST